MSLRDVPLAPCLDTSSADIVSDFFEPLLCNSVYYDRGVGFFTSGWMRIAARGLVRFAHNGGRARWVMSPVLEKPDWEALVSGDSARRDAEIYLTLRSAVADLAATLDTDTRAALAWMLADGILDFRLALPVNRLDGMFHDKFGVFSDADGNQVSFNGSYNDSIQGTHNYESIKVFRSWDPGSCHWVQMDAMRFMKLWANMDPNVRVYEVPEALRDDIISLRGNRRPYPKPKFPEAKPTSEPKTMQHAKPVIPASITLRDYQHKAIAKWFGQGCRGLFEMATGTGKTITALASALLLKERERRLLAVVSCPYKHLVSQWAEEVEAFGFNYVLAFSSAPKWQDKLADRIVDLRAGYIDDLIVLTTHNTFSSAKFLSQIENVSIPLLLIADEVHDVGSPIRSNGLSSSYNYRLGLSATPRRWLDLEGTEAIFGFFGDTCFEFPLADAIPEFLTPYDYYPHFVELDEDEFAEYNKLTKQLIRRAHSREGGDERLLELYLILRQQVIVNASQKYGCFTEIVEGMRSQDHTLVYCSPEQIDRVQDILNSRSIVQSRFTGEESLDERRRLLESFDEGTHQMLVAMKCLDQGVDVPSTHTAILLASSGNPKQFIQRRGRVLRKAPGKGRAAIYDIIVVPTLHGELAPETLEMERKILRRELLRYEEFAALALNRAHAVSVLGPIKRRYVVM